MTAFDQLFKNNHYELLYSKEVTELEDRLFDEPLFQACSSYLYNRTYTSKLTPAEIWYIAECFCIELGKRQTQMGTYFPILFNRLKNTLRTLFSGNFAYDCTLGDKQYILACIDAMLRCSLGEVPSQEISRIVREHMKAFFYQDSMSFISGRGIEPGVYNIMQMPVETDLTFLHENYFKPRQWMLGETSDTNDQEENENEQDVEPEEQAMSPANNQQIASPEPPEPLQKLGLTAKQCAIIVKAVLWSLDVTPKNMGDLGIPLHLISGFGKVSCRNHLNSKITESEIDALHALLHNQEEYRDLDRLLLQYKNWLKKRENQA